MNIPAAVKATAGVTFGLGLFPFIAWAPKVAAGIGIVAAVTFVWLLMYEMFKPVRD